MVKRSTIWLSLCLFALCASGQFLQHRRTASRPTPSSSYTYIATAFDSADRIIHSSDYTSSADSKLLTISLWFKLSNAAENGTRRTLYWSTAAVFLWEVEDGTHTGSSVNNGMYFVAEDSGFASPLKFVVTSPTFTSGSTWHHFAMSVDMADTAKRFVYVDGSAATVTWINYNNLSLYFTSGGNPSFMAEGDGTSPCTGSLCEVWLAPGQYLDFSDSANLQKFRSAGGKPVSLGSDGSTPTGTAPKVYLKNGFATFQNNLGGGGNFTVTGTLTDDASIP